MAAKKKKINPPPESAGQQVTAPPPTIPLEVATGLEAIRSHGGNDEALYLSAEGAFFEESFMTDRIVTAEESIRFIKRIEALIRGSIEYKSYIGYLRNDLNMNHCSFLSNIDMSTDEVALEMHHAPLTLFQIVELVINHRLGRGQPVTSLSVADEVMRMHFDNKIGLVPLSRSVHKLVHNGSLTVHPAMVHGNWMGILRDYSDGVTEELVAQLIGFANLDIAQIAEASIKIDGSQVTPRLRDDVEIPTREQMMVLLSAPME